MMSIKIGLTGSSGLFGQTFSQIAMGHGHSIKTLRYQSFFEKSSNSLNRELEDCSVIVHSAANTDVEECEKKPLECYRDNLLLTQFVATKAQKLNIPIVLISSTGVYGANSIKPYTEKDIPDPTTHHHRSKLLAETAVENICDNYLIIRTGWLFGGNTLLRKNFVARRIEEALNAIKAGTTMQSNIDQKGCPTWSKDVADTVLHLIQDNRNGTYNCVNQGFATRFEFVSQILKYAKIDARLEGVKASAFSRIANVSPNEMAVNQRMLQEGIPSLPSWQLSLEKYIKTELL